ncbi:MAG: polyphosphate kinase 1 [Prevotellaceae bacterium]|jgi:polyphosphate kinase|nr:polyphosphate kinase 1 [Prevotellaceae bacterium]
MSNRELSWLSFNERVLQEAQDSSVPLIQRLRFLGIFSNNQDEFIKVRLADIVRASKSKDKETAKFSGNYTATELLTAVNQRMSEIREAFSQTYTEILSEMEKQNIRIINELQLNKQQETFCRNYFSSVISPEIVPLILQKSRGMPFLSDENIYLAVKMVIKKKHRYAILQIPVNSSCPRFVVFPSTTSGNEIIFSDDIIRLCLNEIFFMFNYKEITAHTFQLVRDSDFLFADGISENIEENIELGLYRRLHGQTVKLIYDGEMPADLLNLLVTKLNLTENENLFPGGRYHRMRDLMQFPKIRKDLEYVNPEPLRQQDTTPLSGMMKVINTKDILLNYPYHTFNHFIDFLKEAAIDPKVNSIYITLYRAAEKSKVINALINAAKNGKKVVAVIEIFARFDEKQNVEYAELLQKEGVTVIHGVKGKKVHGKLALVRRKNKGYAYVGTGNFNESTARVYSDFGLFTSNPQVVADAASVFDFLQNINTCFHCKQLIVSPFDMRKRFEEEIKHEIQTAQNGEKAFIYAKFNNLTDQSMIKLLYQASCAGVEIRLIVRSACCLQPQIPGQSDNIKAISIIDQYLEHSRMIIFHHSGNENVYIMSADFMSRNLNRRIETGILVTDKQIKQTLKDIFDIQWKDNVKARNLSSLYENRYVEQTEKPLRSQSELYKYFLEL